MSSSSQPLTRRSILAQAWPIILSQATVPLVGLVDTAVIGRTGDDTALAAVSLGAAVMNFVFWAFGFLRMGATGMTSQAFGAQDLDEVQSLLARTICIGAGIGLALLALQPVIKTIAFALMSGTPEAESLATGYATARFWGAPAALAVYAVNGWLLGLGRSGTALVLLVVMNLANIVFDIMLVSGFGMGPAGVGAGTAAAEWTALVISLPLCLWAIRRSGGIRPAAFSWPRIASPARLRRMFVVNADIMIRTLALLLLFTWFTNAGARQGDVMLSANHVLTQLMAIAAFVLDAFAFTAEARVGASIGAGDQRMFWRSIRLTSEFALLGGVLLAVLSMAFGGQFIDLLTTDPDVRATARIYLPMAAAVALIGSPAWMLDGVFIGATRSAALRNAAIVSTVLYIALDLALRDFGNRGAWIAMTASYFIRTISLGAYLPGLARSVKAMPASVQQEPEAPPVH